jgi:hypothetical protein
MKLSKNRKRNKLKLAVLLLLPLLLIGSASAHYFSKDPAPSQPSAETDADEINYNPPTEEETKAAEEHKKEIGGQATTTQNSASRVKPLITSYGVYDGAVEVGARVPQAFESNGTCTLKLTKNSKTVTKSRKATPNVSEMSCGFITIPTSQLSKGVWAAVISYNSAKFSGTSDAVNVRVP